MEVCFSSHTAFWSVLTVGQAVFAAVKSAIKNSCATSLWRELPAKGQLFFWGGPSPHFLRWQILQSLCSYLLTFRDCQLSFLSLAVEWCNTLFLAARSPQIKWRLDSFRMLCSKHIQRPSSTCLPARSVFADQEGPLLSPGPCSLVSAHSRRWNCSSEGFSWKLASLVAIPARMADREGSRSANF